MFKDKNAKAHFRAGQAAAGLKDYDSALKYLGEASSLEPDDKVTSYLTQLGHSS